MSWPYRHIVIVPADECDAANAIAAQIDPDDGSATFGVPLSTDGSKPATHCGCSTLSDEVMANAMYLATTSDPPGLAAVKWWRLNAATGHIIDGNTVHGQIGQPWTFANALAALSLKECS